MKTMTTASASTKPKKKRSKMKGDGRNYAYRAYPQLLPKEEHELLIKQLKLANDYRNMLVEIERWRRAAYAELLRTLSPRLIETEAEVKTLLDEAERIRGEIRTENSKARRKRGGGPSLQRQLREVNARRKPLQEQLKQMKLNLKKHPRYKVLIQEQHQEFLKRRRQAYAKSPLFWPSKNQATQAADKWKGAPPDFMSFSGEGKLAVQFQHGVQFELLTDGYRTKRSKKQRYDYRARVMWPDGSSWRPLSWSRLDREERPIVVPAVTARDPEHSALLRLRVTPDRTVDIPFVYHRPLPPDAKIKWIFLLRRRIGTDWVWKVQFVLESSQFLREQAQDGAVGIDVGWRMLSSPPRLRIAVASGSDGKEEELCLPGWWINGWQKCDHLTSLRSLLRNEVVPEAAAALELCRDQLPEHLHAPTLRLWRSQRKLARYTLSLRRWAEEEGRWDPVIDGGLTAGRNQDVLGHWRNIRKGRPPVISLLLLLETWRKRDKHLCGYERHGFDRLMGSRLDLYRNWANMLSRRYATAYIEDLDLRDFHRTKKAEEDLDEAERIKKMFVRAAGLSMLRDALQQAMSKVVELPAEHTTTTCHACGEVDSDWTDHAELFHECPACGESWDQDLNAARNLLGKDLAMLNGLSVLGRFTY